MREILFKGKRLDNEQWVYGDLENCKIRQKTFIHTYTDDGKYHCQFAVDPETVGQYTGLTDKNGNKVFEGDIIRSYGSLGDAIIHTINWNEKEAYFEIYNEYGSPCGRISQPWIEDFGKEVVGNIFDSNLNIDKSIHDNPELTKGDKK